MTRIMLAILAAATVLCLKASAGGAEQFNNAPWCAVLDMGDGDVVWECEYRTVEDCVPNVLAGNRGFCELNPYGGSTATPVAAHPKLHAARHKQHSS